MKNKNIEYISYVSQDEKTSSHPHYQSIYKNPPEGYEFSSNPVNYRLNSEYDSYIDNLREEFTDLTNVEEAEKFINLRSTGGRQIPKNTKFCFVPTHGCFFTDKNWAGNYEDWTCLTAPHSSVQESGATHGLDLGNEPWVKLVKHVVMKDNCKFIFTHMKQTIESLGSIFGKDFSRKVIYLPLGVQPVDERIINNKLDHFSKKKNLCFLFTNSYGAGVPNFPLRGGMETFKAITKFLDAGYKNVKFYMAGPVPDQIKWEARKHENIHIASRFLEDKEFEQLLFNTDVMLVPAMRVHTISIVNSMKYGIPCLGSDGWGFDQFIVDEFNGWTCEGQSHATYVDEDKIYRDNYYGGWDILPDGSRYVPLNEELANNIFDKLCHIYENRDKLLTMQQNCVNFATKEFDIIKRNDVLKRKLDPFYGK